MSFTVDHERMLHCCMCQKMLQRPVQLNCLHNCCLSCLDNFVGPAGHRSITCPLCKDVTDVPSKGINMFVACLAKTSVASDDMSNCSICAKEGHHGESAEVWCSQCQKSLCTDCLRGHDRFVAQHATVPLEEVCNRSSLPALSTQQCELHAKVLDNVCLTCAVPQCADCCLLCAHAKHTVRLLGSPESDALVGKIKNDISDLRKTLESKSDILQKRKNLVGDLRTARVIHIHELEKRKRALLDSLDEAFRDAKATVHACYDILDEKASELSSSAEQLYDNVGLALKYSHILVDAGGVINLLKQQRVLLSRLRNLAKELEQAKAPLDASKYVIIRSMEPEGSYNVIKTWIGAAVLVTDDLFCGTDQAEVYEARLRSRAQTGEHRLDDTHVAPGVLEFSPASSTFRSPVRCCDVAVSADGYRLLLAAHELGLKEHGMSGAELSSWRPAGTTANGRDEEVTAVKALRDGRVAVGLRYSECVALLRRGPSAGDTWLEDKRVTGLGIRPWRLSVHGDLIAVAECDSGLSLLCLRCLHVQNRQRRDYGIEGMAVTAQALLTASYGRVKLSHGREAYLVDAFSHSGQFLWRQELGDRVTDICAALSGQVVYMASCGTDRVSAVRAEDGRVIEDVLSTSHSLKSPMRLSMGGRGQQTVAAVLSYDKTVTVYRAKLVQ